jgi:tol-pal system protein YbgF
MKRVLLCSLGSVMVLAALTGCATRPRPVPLTDPVYARIHALDIRLAQLERLVRSRSLFRMTSEIQRERGEIQKLKGALARLHHTMSHFREAEGARWIQVYRRLSRLQSSASAPSPTRLPPPAPSPSPAQGSPPAGGPAASYHAALHLIENGHYHSAISAFETFRHHYPHDPLVANADYWEGAAKLQIQDFAGALRDSLRVVRDNPHSAKAPAALFQAGLIELAMGHPHAGRRTLTEVVQRFPHSSPARLAREKLKTLGPGSGPP